MPLKVISLLHLIFCLLLPHASASGITRMPDCPSQCGDVSIPYPFGVGSDCSLDPSFQITCNNTSTMPPKPYLEFVGESVEVVDIRVDNPPQIRIKYPHLLAATCYGRGGRVASWEVKDIDLRTTQYTFSEENWITAIGCDEFVAAITNTANQSFRDACQGTCSADTGYSTNGSCPFNGDRNSVGDGCCRTPITKGSGYVDAKLIDSGTTWRGYRLFPCSYAFVKEKGIMNEPGFSYNFSILSENTTALTLLPVVVRLDWRIVGAQNCLQAQQSSAYVCRNNSVCLDFGAEIGGYLCNCSKGYVGNPYLDQGCKDIDECNANNPCSPNSDCINTLGSFKCSCRRGYTGDGTLEGIGCVFQKRKETKRKEKLFKKNGGLLLQQKTNEGTIRKTKHFPAKELEKATDHFNKSRVLGQGGQGVVYKGMLNDGKIVAIKKLKQVDDDHLEQFINEVVILSQVDHRNVVKLLGCCLENEVPLLVYEFVPNGTLFNLIHDPDNTFPISWNMRLKIAADIAAALAYLHYSTSIPIYHRDIKSSNILIGEKFIVKVSDFGTSKSVEAGKTHLTTLVKGTLGYLDPEYYESGQFTDKSDVYSFGVVLVELLTGQRPMSEKRTQDERSLATRFLASMEKQTLDLILDPLVREQGQKEEVIAVASLAQRCLNSTGKMRPSMSVVATELANYSNVAQTSTVEDESEQARAYGGKPMMISDTQYTWTTSEISSSSDTHPFRSETV
ncbi:hypothetical protein C2S53_000640 [Perilla frutescens var. hirtella]|uniref:Uncharacterized protein n=1 Tax=Perilla frutescens var. hirtella TaxID=608512 RepID=A0AAD4IVS1_PERFH|nr:hypothetical protein C2S53_000640 [Perilla frutescens var. hirtella]